MLHHGEFSAFSVVLLINRLTRGCTVEREDDMQSVVYDNISSALQECLDAPRLRHTYGVAHKMIFLSQNFGEDVERGVLAALLHDLAKQQPSERLEQLCSGAPEAYKFYDTQEYPSLRHATASAVLARGRFGIEDEELLEAIAFHPTGKPNPSRLLKFLMLADYLEPSRKRTGTNVAELDALSVCAPNEAYREMLIAKEEYLRQVKQTNVNPIMIQTLNSL